MPFSRYQASEYFLNQTIKKLTSPDLSIRIHYWGVNPKHYDNPLHRHSFFEICYVAHGEGSYIDDGIETGLERGTLFLSRPGKWHQIKSKEGLSLLFIAFEWIESDMSKKQSEALQDLYNTDHYILQLDEHAPSIHLWYSLLLQATHYHPFQIEITSALALSLILSLSQTILKKEKNEFVLIKKSSDYLYRAKLYIKDNLSQPLQLCDLSTYLHISPRHVSRLFSNAGENFSTYLKKARMKKATELLLTTSLSMKEIADQTGFSSVHYFTKTFSKEIGLPPGQFRKKKQELFNRY